MFCVLKNKMSNIGSIGPFEFPYSNFILHAQNLKILKYFVKSPDYETEILASWLGVIFSCKPGKFRAWGHEQKEPKMSCIYGTLRCLHVNMMQLWNWYFPKCFPCLWSNKSPGNLKCYVIFALHCRFIVLFANPNKELWNQFECFSHDNAADKNYCL